MTILDALLLWLLLFLPVWCWCVSTKRRERAAMEAWRREVEERSRFGRELIERVRRRG